MRILRSRKVTAAAWILIAGMMMTGCSAPTTADGQSTLIGVAKEEQPSSSDADLQLAFSPDQLNGLSAVSESREDESEAQYVEADPYAGAAGVTIVAMDSAKARNEKKYSAWGVTRVMSAIGNLKDHFLEKAEEVPAEEVLAEDPGTAGVAEVVNPAVTVPQETEAAPASVNAAKPTTGKNHTSKNNGTKTEEPSASPESEQKTGEAADPSKINIGDSSDPEDNGEKSFSQTEENGILTDISEAKITVAGNRITGESDPSVKVTLGGVEVSSDYYTVTTEKNAAGTGVTVTVSGDGEHFQGSAQTSYPLW